MHMLFGKNIIATGGAGTLGRAIAERRKVEGWTGKLTVYSTDTFKHERMKRMYPDVNFVQGDIRNPETLYNAMVGHDVCLHLAAVKVIPTSEQWSLDTIDVNINGSINVCIQAMNAGIQHVLGISTDKVCHAANAYGSTKYLMEKIFQEYSRLDSDTAFHLVRYGNVLESTGSVLEAWKKAAEDGQPIRITDPTMTRFWISPQQAVDLVLDSFKLKSGMVLIPKMKALSIGKLAEYTLEGKYEIERVPLRPGEKLDETLLTIEECEYATESEDYFFLRPTTEPKSENPVEEPYSSDMAPELTEQELTELLQNKIS
jgi:UDP-N-acetylglucosamine 4,6-dehydratase/5-epimerase